MANSSWTLRELTLMNWGTYDGTQTIDVTPTRQGGHAATCIEGVNGSGKTTLTDAYMMLMRPVNTIFNAASNASGRSQDKRTVLSYMRGEVGENPKTGEPWLVRDADIIVSAIKGTFATDDGNRLEAAILMCVNCATDTRERKVYATSAHTIDLTMLNDVLPSEFTAQKLKEVLGRDVHLTENYSKYLAVLSQTFGVSPVWTDFQKLTRLLSMVQGEDAPDKSRINDLFKAYVLPASDVRQRIVDAVAAIDDNMRSLDDLTGKKTLIETLEPMGDANDQAEQLLNRLGRLYAVTGRTRRVVKESGEVITADAENKSDTPLALFLEEHKSHLTGLRIATTKTRLKEAKTALAEAKKVAREAEIAYAEALTAVTNKSDSRVQSATAELERNQGALEDAKETLEKAKANLALAESRLESARRVRSRAETQLARDERTQQNAVRTTEDYIARGKRYGLSAWPKTQDAWANMLATILTIDTDGETRLQSRYDELSAEIVQKRSELAKVQERLDMLQKNKAKFGASYPNLVRARDTVAQRMGVSPAELPFLAELIDVATQERQWTTAVNAQLAPVAKRMLIDKSYVARFRKISRDVERQLGLRLSYTEVDADADESCADITPKPGTVASKVEVNWESDYAFSALNIVYRNDAICVEDATDFADETQRYVTRGGHIHGAKRGSIGTNRRDSDILGFVSQSDIEDAQVYVEDCENDIRSSIAAQQRCRREMNEIAERRAFSAEMHRVSFAELDLVAHEQIVAASKEALAECERDVDACQANVSAMRDEIATEETSVRDAADACTASEELLRQAREQTSAANKTLQSRFEAARAAQRAALGKLELATAQHDTLVSQLAWYEDTKRQLDAQDTSALTQQMRETCAAMTSAEEPEADFDGFTAALNRRCSAVTARIQSEMTTIEARLDALSSKFEKLEATLGEHSYDHLSGLSEQQALTAIANSHLKDETIADPWQRPRITWFAHYSHMLEQLRQEWSDIDVIGAKRICARETMDAVETLLANAKRTETDITRRMKDVNEIMGGIRLGSEDHTLNVTHDFRKSATAARTHAKLLEVTDLADATRDANATEAQLDAVCAATKAASELMSTHQKDVMAALDPNEYVNIAFIETRDGHEHKHANLGKLSGGEVQQISACVIGAALLYAMDTEPGERPCYATIVIDEAFVKADEEHSVATLATLIDMGFAPIVSMPPEGVMKLSPCISKLMAVTKRDMRSRVDAISLEELIASQQASQ